MFAYGLSYGRNSAPSKVVNVKVIETHFCNRTQSIHYPFDPLESTFPSDRLGEINCRHSFVGVWESILSRLEIGGHDDRQAKRDRLGRLPSLFVPIGEDERNVYARDVQIVKQAQQF